MVCLFIFTQLRLSRHIDALTERLFPLPRSLISATADGVVVRCDGRPDGSLELASARRGGALDAAAAAAATPGRLLGGVLGSAMKYLGAGEVQPDRAAAVSLCWAAPPASPGGSRLAMLLTATSLEMWEVDVGRPGNATLHRYRRVLPAAQARAEG